MRELLSYLAEQRGVLGVVLVSAVRLYLFERTAERVVLSARRRLLRSLLRPRSTSTSCAAPATSSPASGQTPP